MSAEKKNKFRNSPQPENTLDIEEQTTPRKDIEDVEVKPEKEKKNKPKSGKSSVTKPVQTEPKAPTADKMTLIKRWQQLVKIYQNERTTKIIGLSLILCSGYLAVAFISYFANWSVDQDKVLGGASELFKPETHVANWLGKIGALVSHWFMYKGFGAASFILVPVFLLYGLQKLLQKPVISVSAFNAKWLFMMVWSSLLFSYIFSDRLFFMGGGFGYFINGSIANYIGNIGLIAFIAFSLLSFLVITVNLNFKLPVKASIDADEKIEEEIQAALNVQTQNKIRNSAFNELKDMQLSPEEEEALLNFEIINRENKQPVVDEPVQTSQPVDLTNPMTGTEKTTKEAESVIELNTELPAPEPRGEPELEIAAPVEEPVALDEENKAASLVEQFGEYDPTLDLGSYQFPTFDLLNDYGHIQSKVNQDELIANKNKILSTLKNYGIEIDKIMATVGPTVTLYEIVPAAGVRISKIKNLEDDIALSLAALGIRIIAPIPGKGTIGIEVPNQTPEMVPMKNILASEKFNNSSFELPIALGKTISNEIFVADLAKMPHLLMAGATGQGKSVGLNAVLVSLLYKKHPAQVKFVLVDPKKVELTLFNKIERHFLAKLPNSEDAIITDNTKVIHTLNSLCIEMDNRYALLQDAQVRNIKEYNAKFIQRKLNPHDGHKYLPYIVLVVDEFADLIMTAGKEVETPIARLAQLARAIGIHLIIATQRPSVNIITGTIKANFPARIAFRVTSKIDSRTILDSGGADQLIGRGDMLLSTGNDLIRIQCAFVDTPEVDKITEFIGNQRAYPSAFMLPEYVGEEGEEGKEEVDLSERDKMFDDAAKLVVQFQQGSASFLQRKLKLGYNRAGRIVDQLEAAGIIGPFEGSKAREVLIKDMAQLDEIIQRIKGA